MRWTWVALLGGCAADSGDTGDDGGHTSADTDSPPADTDTDPTPVDTDTTDTDDTPTTAAYPKPTVLTAFCTTMPNVLRVDCAVTVEPAQPVQIAFAKADGTGPTRVHTSDLVATDHSIVLYFLEPDTDYDVSLTATTWPDDPVYETSALPGIPPLDVRSSLAVTGVSSVPMMGTHLPCNGDAIAVIYSSETGRMLWYQSLDPAGTLGFLDMIQFTEDHTVLGETGPSVVEFDLRGQEVIRLDSGTDYNAYLHHDIFKRNGQYYLLYQEDGPAGTPLLDSFIVLDSTGLEIARWRSFENLDIPISAAGDWMHTNTIYVDATGDVFLSLLGQDSILKIEGDLASPDFGTHLWTLAGAPGMGLGQDFTVDWSVVDGPNAFGDQHSALLRHDGRLMFLDNDNGRGLVITVDDAAMTATVDEAWETVQASCGPQGTARDSVIGNSFVGCSGDDMTEYDPTMGEVWSAEVDCGAGGFVSMARFYPLDGW